MLVRGNFRKICNMGTQVDRRSQRKRPSLCAICKLVVRKKPNGAYKYLNTSYPTGLRYRCELITGRREVTDC